MYLSSVPDVSWLSVGAQMPPSSSFSLHCLIQISLNQLRLIKTDLLQQMMITNTLQVLEPSWGQRLAHRRPLCSGTHPGLLTLEQEDLWETSAALLHGYCQQRVVGAAVQHRLGLKDARQRKRLQLSLHSQNETLTNDYHFYHQPLKSNRLKYHAVFQILKWLLSLMMPVCLSVSKIFHYHLKNFNEA